MGLVNVVKTLSQSIGPIFTGVLAGSGRLWVAFVIAGALKLLYDALMLVFFVSYHTKEGQTEVQGDEARRGNQSSKCTRSSRDLSAC